MCQVVSQFCSKVFGGEAHCAYHAFDDVAVVAKQSARGVAVMAVVGADLTSIEAPRTNGASVVLDDKEGFNLGFGHSRPSLALFIQFGFPCNRVISEFFISLFPEASPFRRFAERTSFGSGLRGVSSFFTSSFYFGATGIFTLSFTEFLRVATVILSVPRNVFFPLFGGAIGLSHTTKPSSQLNTHAT